MSDITEVIVEPNKLYVGSIFKLKVRVKDDFKAKKYLISENGLKFITEENKNIRTDWGE